MPGSDPTWTPEPVQADAWVEVYALTANGVPLTIDGVQLTFGPPRPDWQDV